MTHRTAPRPPLAAARRPTTTTSRRGVSLAELLAVVAIIGLVVGVAGPAWGTFRARASLRLANRLLVTELRLLRARAIALGRNVGWTFQRNDEGGWSVRTCIDGDGDGLRQSDLDAGIDRAVDPPRPLLASNLACRLGFPNEGVTDPSDPRTRLGPGAPPFRFGRSKFVSFSPLGESTPGSIFLVDTTGRAYCLRLHGATGRPHLLRWEPLRQRWLQEP